LYKNQLSLLSVEAGCISNKQLLSCFNSLKKFIKQNGSIIIRIFPNLPVSKRPAEQPLGKGKANTNI